jgi:hypothetical protein
VQIEKPKAFNYRLVDYLSFKDTRYGSMTRYRKTCAQAHESTGNRCTECGVRMTRQDDGHYHTTANLHHLQYMSKTRWLKDFWLWVQGRPFGGPWGAVVPHREVIGITAVSLCSRCHDRIHGSKDWIDEREPQGAIADTLARYWVTKALVLPSYRNRNTFTSAWRLRLKWRLRNWRARVHSNTFNKLEQ